MLDPIPFPTDRSSLLRCVRTFLDLLALRVQGGVEGEAGCDYALPGGLTLDAVASSLIAHAAQDDTTGATFGLAASNEQDDLEEIVDGIKALLARAAPPGMN